jgi:hypothetical protein
MELHRGVSATRWYHGFGPQNVQDRRGGFQTGPVTEPETFDEAAAGIVAARRASVAIRDKQERALQEGRVKAAQALQPEADAAYQVYVDAIEAAKRTFRKIHGFTPRTDDERRKATAQAGP